MQATLLQKIIHIILGILSIKVGVIDLLFKLDSGYDIIFYVLFIDYIIFGVFIILCSVPIKRLLEIFTFMNNNFGIGCFFILVGSLLCDGWSWDKWWYSFLVSILFVTVGIVHLVFHCSGKEEVERPEQQFQEINQILTKL